MLSQVWFSLFVLIECHHAYQSSWNSNYNHHKIPQDVMVDVVNNLALKLLAIHNEGNNNNIAISPYGALSVLVALGEGLRGEGVYEIQKAANIPSDIAIVRVGLRDIHRHLKSYFIPEEGFLSGLSLSHENVTLNREYEDILRFYGYDVDAFNNALYPDFLTTTTESMTTDTQTMENKEEKEMTTEITSTETTESDRSSMSESTVLPTEPSIVTTTQTVLPTESSTVTETKTESDRITRSESTPVPIESTIAITTILPTTVTINLNTLITTPESVVDNTETLAVTVESIDKTTEAMDLKTENSIKVTEPSASTITTNTQAVEFINENKDEETSTLSEIKITTESTDLKSESENSATTISSTTISESSTIIETNTGTEEIEHHENKIETSTLSEINNITEGMDMKSESDHISTAISESSAVTEPTSGTIVTEIADDARKVSEETVPMEDSSNGASTEMVITSASTLPDNSRSARSVVDYVIARYYDEHFITQRPPPLASEKELFFLINGKDKEYNINYMTYDTVLPFHYIHHLNTLALRFPLDSSRYYLLLLLPENGEDVDRLICNLRLNTSLKYIIDNLRYTHVKAVIPSFMLKGYIVLTSTFQKMGIRKVFEPRQADFSPMTADRNIYVTNIEQAITVNIRNYVDPVTMNSNRYLHQDNPVLFQADHPFLYFVIDSEINVTLMAGKIINPLNSRIR